MSSSLSRFFAFETSLRGSAASVLRMGPHLVVGKQVMCQSELRQNNNTGCYRTMGYRPSRRGQGRGLPEKLHSAGVVLPKRYTGAGRSHPVARRGKRVQKRRAGLALLGSMCMAGGVSHALSAEADAPGCPAIPRTARSFPRWWSLATRRCWASACR